MPVQVTCINCGKTWSVPPSWGAKKYCTIKCRKAHINGDVCKIDGCPKQPHSHGLCPMHYQRQRQKGSTFSEVPKGKHIFIRAMPVHPHGTHLRYQLAGCRCFECRLAQREHVGRFVPKDRIHGTYEMWRARCRCPECFEAHQEYVRDYFRKYLQPQRDAVAQTRGTIQYLRAQTLVNWRDDPAPHRWAFTKRDGSEDSDTEWWDNMNYRNGFEAQSGELTTSNEYAARSLMLDGCPTIQLLTDKALSGKLTENERVMLAASIQYRQRKVVRTGKGFYSDDTFSWNK